MSNINLRAVELQFAITEMADRLGDARADAAAHNVWFATHGGTQDRTARDKAKRAAKRRRAALNRLTAAMRDLATKGA